MPQIFLLLSLAFVSFPARADDFAAHFHLTVPPRNLPPLVFEDAGGAQHALADYRGRYVLLNIWATWCGPCVREMPSLEALQKNIGATRLAVLPLSEDRDGAAVSAFYRRHAITRLPVAIDAAGIAPSVFHLPGLPTTLLVNPQGQEIARVEGDADWDSPQALAALRAQIK